MIEETTIPVVDTIKTARTITGVFAVREDDSWINSRAIYAAMREYLGSLPREEFWAVYTDAKHRPIAAHMVSRGTLTCSLVHPREVYGPAISLAAANVVLVHNHPSGDPEPSPEDREITRRLVAAGHLLGIPVLDHIVIAGVPARTGPKYVSFAERGMI